MGGISSQPKLDGGSRFVHVNHRGLKQHDTPKEQNFPNNMIVTSRYTAWNFLPKNLFEQFLRVANFYFLVVAIIQIINPDVPVSAVTSVAPLVIVIAITALKQGYEDYLRHKADAEVNNRMYHVLREKQFIEIKSQEIKVGDVIKVVNNDSFPCDMVMLSSSEDSGECFVTTAGLDGETNLKNFYCVPSSRRLRSIEAFNNLRAVIECQNPIEDLYRFTGRILVNNKSIPAGLAVKREGGQSGGDQEITAVPLSASNVLLRGARLKNTPYIYGLAIYTGPETKMALNSKGKRLKFSRVERRLNIYLIASIVVLFLIITFSTGMLYLYQGTSIISNAWYLNNLLASSITQIFRDWSSYLVLYNYLIPISLYVTIEVQKFAGSAFLGWDQELYDAVQELRAKANTSDLNEELGQIEYLFSDKTGTLTENDMQFRQCSVAGTRYVDADGMLCVRPDSDGIRPVPLTQVDNDVDNFLQFLALCHTCRVEKQKDEKSTKDKKKKMDFEVEQMKDDEDKLALQAASHKPVKAATQSKGPIAFTKNESIGFDYEYQASSPDEKAFLEACRRYGYVFHGTIDGHMVLQVHGVMRKYKLLHTLDFDADRKCMSVILQTEAGEYMVISKGAETSMLPRSVSGDKETTMSHVVEYAVLGLRTLVICVRYLTEPEYLTIATQIDSANLALKDREKRLSEAYKFAEQHLTIAGVTAIEDRLQDGVKETIVSLRKAGIKVWVLTGDKEETAVNISYSAGLFHDTIRPVRITQQRCTEECGNTVATLVERVRLETNQIPAPNPPIDYGLIVDGASLNFLLADHKDYLLRLCMTCTAVLCCRVTPMQKALVVRLIKDGVENAITCAIGDGANDVSMIQEAHVGLGIFGKEGRQAARTADYAFSRFRHVHRVLLMHGHYYYVRISTLVLYFFYKNIAFVMSQFYFIFFSAYSANPIYDTLVLTMFNITMTSLPIVIFGIFEQHVDKQLLVTKPALYKLIRDNSMMTTGQFFKWTGSGFYHSLVSFFIPYLYFSFVTNCTFPDGPPLDLTSYGTFTITCVVWVTNIKLAMETYYWTAYLALSFILTIVVFYGMYMFYAAFANVFASNNDYSAWGTFITVWGYPIFWILLVLIIAASLLPDLLYKAIKDTRSYEGRRRLFLSLREKYGMNKKKDMPSTITSSKANILEHEY